MSEKFCSYFDELSLRPDTGYGQAVHLVKIRNKRGKIKSINTQPEPFVPSRRLPCPVCGRRVLMRIVFDSDGDFKYAMPKHKPKGWWKLGRKKKISRDISSRTRR